MIIDPVSKMLLSCDATLRKAGRKRMLDAMRRAARIVDGPWHYADDPTRCGSSYDRQEAYVEGAADNQSSALVQRCLDTSWGY